MSVTPSRISGAEFLSGPVAPPAGEAPAEELEKFVAARLAHAKAAPTPSPVHRLQAELARLTPAEDVSAERLYPGWFRLAFPLVTSGLLWVAILWGTGVIA